ncbi:MAG: DUF7305 domain-containing protein [Gemmatimonadota bacterium]
MNLVRRRPGRTGTGEAGFALPAVLFTLVVMSVIAVASVRVSLTDRTATWASRAGARAQIAASTGAQEIWANWPAAADALAPGDSIDLGWATLPDRSRYHGVITRVDSGTVQEVRVLRVEGRSRGTRGGQRVIELWATQGRNLYDAGVGARSDLTIDTDALVDSYDSSLGPYGGTNIDTNGNVHADGDVFITNNSIVDGFGSASGILMTGTGGVATQGTASGVPPHGYPSVPCPAGAYTPAASLPAGSYTYNQVTGSLTIDNTSVQLPAGQYYFNDVLVKKSNGNLGPVPGSSVTIFVRGTLSTAQQGRLNDNGLPIELAIFGCGPTTNHWTFNQNSQIWAAIYAPDDDIELRNDSDVHGSLVGLNVLINQGGTGPVSVHYDEQLSAVLAGSTRQQMLRPWAQIAR